MVVVRRHAFFLNILVLMLAPATGRKTVRSERRRYWPLAWRKTGYFTCRAMHRGRFPPKPCAGHGFREFTDSAHTRLRARKADLLTDRTTTMWQKKLRYA